MGGVVAWVNAIALPLAAKRWWMRRSPEHVGARFCLLLSYVVQAALRRAVREVHRVAVCAVFRLSVAKEQCQATAAQVSKHRIIEAAPNPLGAI